MSSDDIVGAVSVQISDIISKQNNGSSIGLNLMYKDKVAGIIKISSEFEWPLT